MDDSASSELQFYHHPNTPEEEEVAVSLVAENNVATEARIKDDAWCDTVSTVPTAGGDKYNLLGEAIHFYHKPSLKKHARVPPPTPDYDIDYQRPIVHQPLTVAAVLADELPHVSDEGIRFSIHALGKVLGYNEYEYDLVQFWLLDILIDCLWKAQDIYKFEKQEQKVILEWVSDIFKLIADPVLNLSRKQFLKIFKDILYALYKHIASTCEEFPATSFIDQHLRNLLEQEELPVSNSNDSNDDDSASSTSNSSVSTFSIHDTQDLLVHPEFDIKQHINHLKKNNPVGNIVHTFTDQVSTTESIQGQSENDNEGTLDYSTSLSTSDSSQYINTSNPFWANFKKFKPFDLCSCDHFKLCTCYNPYVLPMGAEDTDYADVLLNVNQSNDDKSSVQSGTLKDTSISTNAKDELADENIKSASGQVIDYLTKNRSTTAGSHQVTATTLSLSGQPRNVDINYAKLNLSQPQVGAEIADIDRTAEDAEAKVNAQRQLELEQRELEIERQHELEVMKEWTYFKLMEQRKWDMDDQNVGWVPWISWMKSQSDEVHQENFSKVAESFAEAKSLEPAPPPIMNECPGLRSLNFNILRAVVDFVFEYFYENFHFTLIKLAFRCPPYLITQNLNQEWNIPKVMKSTFKKPKEPSSKIIIEKKKKTMQSKSKVVHESNNKEKEDRESKSRSKIEIKDKNAQTNATEKKDKNNKDKEGYSKSKLKLSLDGQAELDKIRGEEMKKGTEEQVQDDRLYLFPLADAASEQLFMNIFENWVKIKERNDLAENKSKKRDVKEQQQKKRK